MLRALAHTIVHVVALWCDDPVLPLDILELDIEVLLAADADVITAAQRALANCMLGVVITELNLCHQVGPLGWISTTLAAQVLVSHFTVHFQLQALLPTIQKGLHGAGDRKGLPPTPYYLNAALDQEGAVATVCF